MLNVIAPKRTIVRDPAPQPGQLQAIEQLDRDLIVSAGAGSGKTWVLTERYIEMLNNGTRPEQIVAITFTKKAAAEMRGRIRQAIKKMEETSTDPNEARYWSGCKQALEQATITTIHGFCTRLLRDAPLEAGVDPDFRVLDETEAQLMARHVFTEVVDTSLARCDQAAETLYRELGDRRAVVESALALHQQMRTYHVKKHDVLQETLATLDARRTRFVQLRDELLQLVVQGEYLVHDLINQTKKTPQYLVNARDWLNRLHLTLTESIHWDGRYDKAICAPFEQLKATMWRNYGPDELKELHGTLKQSLTEWLSYTEAPQYRQLLQALLDLVEQAGDHYWQRKRREQALDFNDLEQLSFDVLSAHPHVAARWQNRLTYLMVDEFQDTNGLQKAILDRLTGTDGRVKRFVVGDGKQSIYKFRGADVAVFQRTEAEIRQNQGASVSLDVNFRTQQRLIAYINSLFHFLMNKEQGTADFITTYEPLHAFRKPPHARPTVELLAGTIDPADSGDLRQMEAMRVARRIRAMVDNRERLVWERPAGVANEQARPVNYGDVALLLATRTHLHVYEQALKNEHIPYVVVGGRGFYDKQEVVDVLNVLKLVQNRDDELALLGFLRSPFVHLSDETLYWLTRENRLTHAFFHLEEAPQELASEQWEWLSEARDRFIRWERMKQTESVRELIRHIVNETGYFAVLLASPNGEQAALNVEKLIDMAADIDRQGLSLLDFLEWIDTLKDEEMQETEAAFIRDRAKAVVIMTVHAAKGLEFPVVVLPECARNVLQGAAAPRVSYTLGEGLAVKLFRPNNEPQGDGLFDQFREAERERELQEAYRLFYVAVTRARDYLLLAGSQAEQKKPREELKNDWLDWIVKHLGAKQLSDLTEQEYSPDGSWSLKVTWDSVNNTTGTTEATRFLPDVARATENDEAVDEDYPLLAPLHVPDEPINDLSHSVTALIDYTVCERLYVLKHCLKVPPSTTPSDETGDNGVSGISATTVGNVLHRVMEQIEQDEAYEMLIRQACYAEGVDASLHTKLVETVQPLVENYSSSDWFEQSRAADSVHSELPFYYRLGSHIISGVIDKVIIDKRGDATVLDFKTNHIQNDAHLQRLLQGYKIQVQVYAAVIQHLLKRRVKEAVVYFLRDDLPVTVEVGQPLLRQEHQRWYQSLDKMIALAHSGELPPCKDEKCHCRQYLVVE